MNLADLSHLLRLPRSLSALTDAAAALVLSGVASWTTGRMADGLAITLGLLLFYTGGAVLDDLLDLAGDREERPERPLPARRVHRLTAGMLAGTLLLVGLSLCAVVGPNTLVVGVLLLIAVVVYHAALARRPILDPLGLALCRVLGWSLVLTAMGQLEPLAPAALVLAGVYEFTARHARLGLEAGLRRGVPLVLLLGWAAAALGGLALAAAHEPLVARSVRSAGLVVVLLWWAAWVLPPLVRALAQADPQHLRASVESATRTLSLFALLVTIALSAWMAAIFCLLVVAGQTLLRRHLASPGASA